MSSRKKYTAFVPAEVEDIWQEIEDRGVQEVKEVKEEPIQRIHKKYTAFTPVEVESIWEEVEKETQEPEKKREPTGNEDVTELPIKHGFWKFIPNKSAILQLTTRSLRYNSAELPIEVASFFNYGDILPSKACEIKLKYNNVDYDGFILFFQSDIQYAQIYWSDKFGDLLREFYSKYAVNPSIEFRQTSNNKVYNVSIVLDDIVTMAGADSTKTNAIIENKTKFQPLLVSVKDKSDTAKQKPTIQTNSTESTLSIIKYDKSGKELARYKSVDEVEQALKKHPITFEKSWVLIPNVSVTKYLDDTVIRFLSIPKELDDFFNINHQFSDKTAHETSTIRINYNGIKYFCVLRKYKRLMVKRISWEAAFANRLKEFFSKNPKNSTLTFKRTDTENVYDVILRADNIDVTDNGDVQEEVQISKEKKGTYSRYKVGKFTASGELIKIYPSQRKAAIDEGIDSAHISRWCRNEKDDPRGFIWRRINDTDKETNEQEQNITEGGFVWEVQGDIKEVDKVEEIKAVNETTDEETVQYVQEPKENRVIEEIVQEADEIQILRNLNLDENKDRKILRKVLTSDLISLGVSNKIARVLALVIIYGNPTKSDILRELPNERKKHEEAIAELIKINWVKIESYLNSNNRKVNTYQLTIACNTLYNLLESKNNIFIGNFAEIVVRVQTDYNRLTVEHDKGFIKLQYLPEFKKLVDDLVALGITEEAAKALIFIDKYNMPYSKMLTEARINKIPADSLEYGLYDAGWITQTKGVNSGQRPLKTYKLTKSIYDIALDYAYDKSTLIEKRLKELKVIVEIVEKYHKEKNKQKEEEKEKNKLTELQETFISSFTWSLISYTKITESIFDLKMRSTMGEVRACIVELSLSDDGKTLITNPLGDEVFEDNKEILLYGYYKDYKQYVVWNFAKNYTLLRKRNISVPLDLLDESMGQVGVLVKKLPSNAEVITVPEKQPYKAITYWKEAKEKEDKWFI